LIDGRIDRRFQGAEVVSILPFVRKTGIAFDDRATKTMGEAFDAACRALHDAGQPPIVYEIIAKRIIDVAKRRVSRLSLD